MAANGVFTYRLGRNRLHRGLMDGFGLSNAGILVTTGTQHRRNLFLGVIDSAQIDCPWGRLAFEGTMADDAVLTVHVLATNETEFVFDGAPIDINSFVLNDKVEVKDKATLFHSFGALHHVGSTDLLLYSQKGRYLWVWLELTGAGEASFDHFRIYVPGDNFYRTFPEIYHKDGEFFHRYLSIFSSLYGDLQEKIDHLDKYIDVDTCPDEVLPLFADWLGIQLDGNFLDTKSLRTLLKVAPKLIATKGTKSAIELVVSLFVEEDVYIIERNLLNDNQRAMGGDLYGDTPYDFTVLINRKGNEGLRTRLQFLIDQFKPMRSRGNIVFLGNCSGLDAFSYMDINGTVLQNTPGVLDDGEALMGMTYLE